MRFSKAPLIATLMAVVLSLLVILPALAENTDGHSYQGRTLDDELIVGVFADPADSQGVDTPVALSLQSTSLTRAYMLDTDNTATTTNAADPRDTFFNGKLYVSNQGKAFNTVLVTHLADDSADAEDLGCVSVRIRNENTGEQITLNLVPTQTEPTDVDGNAVGVRTDQVYFQNYFKVVDRDGEDQVDAHDGPYVCDDTVLYPDSGERGNDGVPVDDVDLTDVAPPDDGDAENGIEAEIFVATIALDESLARINASDGDRLTIRAGTHIQEIYVDGEAPEFSEITPADGERFKSAALSIGFEIRDDGAGLRHDGENVVSVDGDAVLHDAATTTNTGATAGDARIGDGDGITDREPISNRRGGSQDIDVTFYTPLQAEELKDYEDAKADAADARKAADAANALAGTAAGKAREAADAATVAGMVDGLSDVSPGGSEASSALDAAQRELDAAATALEAVAMGTAGIETATRDAATAAGEAVTGANGVDAAITAIDEDVATLAADAANQDADGAFRKLLNDAKTALGVAKSALEAAEAALDAAVVADTGAIALEADAVQALTDANTAEGVADATAGGPEDNTYGTLVDDHGSSGWTMLTRGVAYEANIVYNIVDQGKDVLAYQWMASATDRVGNTGKADKDRFDLVVDTLKPWVKEARTGISYNVSKNREVRNRSYIALTFVNQEGGAEDPIAASSLDVRDFIVEGFEVLDIIQPERITDKKDPDAKAIDKDGAFDAVGARDPRSRVYLELDSELDSDQTPRIQILGGAVSDLAGNPNDPPQTIESEDKIPAGLTITVQSSDSSSGRVVATEDGTFTVTVDADEPLKRTPRVYFSPFGVTATHGENKDLNEVDDGGTLARLTLNDDVEVSTVGGASVAPALDVIERGLAWTQDYDADSGAFVDEDTNVYVVLVWSEDLGGNAGGSSGWTNASDDGQLSDGDALDLVALDDAGLLIEIDRDLAKADPEVLPSTDDDLVTESANPYMQLSFSETTENTADITFVGVTAVEDDETTTDVDETVEGIDDVEAFFRSVKDGTDTVNLDAHKKVTLTAVTLDGTDVSDSVGPGMSTTGDKFTVALRGLAAGEHTLTYSAVDEAGNELTDVEVDFEVQAHAAYKIVIRPGWNLISFPGTPADTGIGDVMGTGLDAAIVLGYQNGAWVSAIRNEGEWLGTLTDIVGGYGYWVQTTVFESISAVIPSADPTDVLPSVPVIAGWNLLGVVDISQGAAGKEPIGKEEADDYFVSIDWRVGYYFRNASNDWQKIVPDAEPSDGEAEILNGKGYWIWSIRPGKLVP